MNKDRTTPTKLCLKYSLVIFVSSVLLHVIANTKQEKGVFNLEVLLRVQPLLIWNAIKEACCNMCLFCPLLRAQMSFFLLTVQLPIRPAVRDKSTGISSPTCAGFYSECAVSTKSNKCKAFAFMCKHEVNEQLTIWQSSMLCLL